MPRVIVDGREVEVVPGSFVLAAVRKLGIDIPALCYYPGCEPNTSCMACVVWLKNPDRVVPACATLAEEGMQIESETPRVHALRRMALELLLSDHAPESPTGCTCRKRDHCRLRQYAEVYGARPARFGGPTRQDGPAGDHRRNHQHPQIEYDPSKCILCGICVALARQAGEPLGLTFVGRGFDVRVDVPFDGPLAEALQTAARRCAGACPTGALALRVEEPRQPSSGTEKP